MSDLGGPGTQSCRVAPQDLLLLTTDTLDDLERVRISLANRYQSLTSDEVVGEKGGWFGKGIPVDHPVAARLAGLRDALVDLEHQAELDVRRAMRQQQLAAWVKATVGVGEKQAARLLAAIGDPAERKTVSQLWAYCGYAPGQKRQKGVKGNWNSKAKMRAFLIAESCIKQVGTGAANLVPAPNHAARRRSPYRDTYDNRRARTAETHPEWTDGHSHNDALRVTAKAILRDIWIESRRAMSPSAPMSPTPDGTEFEGRANSGAAPEGKPVPIEPAPAPHPLSRPESAAKPEPVLAG